MGAVREFDEFAGEARPRLMRAFVAVRGADGAADATAEALAYGWENWDRVRVMANPMGYLYRVGRSRTRARFAATRAGSSSTGSNRQVDTLRIPLTDSRVITLSRSQSVVSTVDVSGIFVTGDQVHAWRGAAPDLVQ